MGEGRTRGPYAKSAGRRDDILRAARAAIAENGYARASLRDIAERVGLTHAGLQYYFPTKEAILTALLDERDADAEQRGREQDAPSLNGTVATLADILRATISAHLETPELTGLWAELTIAARSQDHPAHDHFVDRFDHGRALITERLGSPAKHEALPGGLSAAEAAVLVVAMIEGLETQWLLDPSLDIITPLTKFIQLVDGSPDHRRTKRSRPGQ